MSESKEQQPQIMPLPYVVDIGDSLSDDSDCWVIDCEHGSVAEMQCAADVQEATARFIVRAANNHEPLVSALKEAKELIKIWHGAEAWDVYDVHSPEMIRINRALALAEKES